MLTRTIALTAFLVATTIDALAADSRVVDLPTRPGVTQRFIYLAPEHPVASAILFAGGNGSLLIRDDGGFGGYGDFNFLVRTRSLFVDRGIAVAVVDAPSDRQGGTYLAGRRQTPEHLADIKAVIGWLKERESVPVWLIGTSRGTQSAAYVATELAGKDGGPDGLVLTSTIVVDNSRTVPKMPLESLRIPVLVVHHEQDGCMYCPFDGAKAMIDRLKNSPRKALMGFTGGISTGNACEALAHHGFNGIETVVVDRIAEWIRG